MAIYIEMKKIKFENNIYYYTVNTDDFLFQKPLLIGIDKQKMKLYFFTENQTNKPIFSLNFNSPVFPTSDHPLPINLIYRIYKKILETLKSDSFSDFIIYAA